MKPHYLIFRKSLILALVVFGLGAVPNANAIISDCYEPCGETTVFEMGTPDLDFRQMSEGLERPWGLENDAILNLSNASVNLAFTIGSSNVTQIGGTVKDSDGNYIVTGGFTGVIDFGSETITSSKDYDFFIAKYDNSGNPIWIRTATGLASLADNLSVDGGIALTVNPTTGEIYVGGTFVKQMDFLDGNGDVEASLTDGRADNLLNYELFVAKYAADGTLQWTLGGESGSAAAEADLNTGRNMVTAIILDGDGNPYIGGRFSGTNLFGETVSLVGEGDFFLASLDTDGSAPFWVSVAGTPGDDVLLSLSVDALGYINVLGAIGEGLFELPNSTVTYDNATGNYDTFLMSYDINGEWYFASFLGAGEQVVGNDVASNLDGSIYVAGQFIGEASFVGSTIVLESDSAIDCAFLVKYDIEGDALWAVRTGGSNYVKANRVVNDAEGSVYVYGLFSEMAIFGVETPMPDTLYSNGITDMFLMKYDTDGNYQWVRRLDGSDTESLDLISSVDNSIRSNPTQMVYSDVNGPEVILSGDFNGTLFDITAPTDVRLGFVAAIDVSEIVTGVDEKAVASLGLLAYPNPMNDEATVAFSTTQTENVRVEVLNALGQQVALIADRKFAAGRHRLPINLANVDAGMYVLNITTASQRSNMRLSVTR